MRKTVSISARFPGGPKRNEMSVKKKMISLSIKAKKVKK